ncbi:hypothetical protein J2S57_004131 [Kineosporia succinea]|uniref:Uncharacterized protein n=1 Tax=Kineosporia succinea TaxID=84632 RepID=A0ABT9P6Q2_9ACTN|nr:hypothetical protein [Kineosporia succinea]
MTKVEDDSEAKKILLATVDFTATKIASEQRQRGNGYYQLLIVLVPTGIFLGSLRE